MTLVEDVIHKPSGLNEISPGWAKRLVHQNLPFSLSFTWFKWYFELDSPSKCVVGEAYDILQRMRENAEIVVSLDGDLVICS